MEKNDAHLRDYLKVINKRKYTVFTFFTVVFSIVLIGALSPKRPVYTATTKIIIEKAAPSSFIVNNRYIPYDPGFYETQYQLINSILVARRVVKLLALDSAYGSYIITNDKKQTSIAGWIIGWFKRFYSVTLTVVGNIEHPQSFDSIENDAETDDDSYDRDKVMADMIANIIHNGITVSPEEDSNIVNISFSSTDPEFAKMVANTIPNAYEEEILEMKMNSSRNTLKWLAKKAEEERAKLEISENILQKYMRDNNIITLENRVTLIPQKLSTLGKQLLEAETKRKELEVLYQKIKKVSKNVEDVETMPAISSDSTLQSFRTRILEAEQNIIELSKKYGKKHPKMIKAMGDMTVLMAKKEREIKRVIESIKNDYELAIANEKNIRELLAKTKDEALNLNEKFIQYSMLKGDVETNRQLFDTLIKKIKEQSITEEIQTADVWVIEKAERPGAPGSNKLSSILLGIIIGLSGGVGLAFFFDYLDNTIKYPEEAEAKLRIPVLGMISFLKNKVEDVDHIVFKEPLSSFAEAYKGIRTSVLLSSADSPPKSILITSMNIREGKTVTSVNLAMAIAQSEHSAVLIDGDLRRPRIHKIFNLNNSKGLSTYLAGTSDMDIIYEGPIKNLKIIPSGPISPNPSELVGSNKMKKLLGILNKKFDIIICDSPPLMTVTEGLILSKIVDGTIIVTRSGKTTYEIAGKGLKSLQDINSHILGMVINAADVRKSGYYYSDNYSDYYEESKK